MLQRESLLSRLWKHLGLSSRTDLGPLEQQSEGWSRVFRWLLASF